MDDAWRLQEPHFIQQHDAWPGRQGLRQPWAATLGTAVKATATNTDEARKEYGEKLACLCFSDSSENSRKAFSYPLK